MAKIILASQSPRRHTLLRGLDVEFEIKTKDIDETYPEQYKREEIALYLSQLKAKAYQDKLQQDEVLITADTIVCLDNRVIGKPKNREDAKVMLQNLSGNRHDVITAVTITTNNHTESFYNQTAVHFGTIEANEIDYYLNHYKPFDKAGSYGIQEWIGYIAIDRIEGCFYNVMGLPVRQVYQALKKLNAL